MVRDDYFCEWNGFLVSGECSGEKTCLFLLLKDGGSTDNCLMFRCSSLEVIWLRILDSFLGVRSFVATIAQNSF